MMMKYIFCFFLFFLILCNCTQNKISENSLSKETVKISDDAFSPNIKDLKNNNVEVTVYTIWKENKQKMRDELRERAEIEILQYKGLLQISSEIFKFEHEENEYFDLLSNMISSTVYGRIDSIVPIYEKTLLINEEPYFEIRFKGHVIEEEPDLLFSVDVELNKIAFSNADVLNFEITTTKPAFVIVFNFDIDENIFEVLYPTNDLPSTQIQPDITFSIPPKNFKDKISVYTDEKKKKQSSIFVIATKEKWSLPLKEKITFEDFKNWLGNIPLPIRAIDFESYVVYME